MATWTLKTLREKLLRLRPESVADAAGLDVARLREIEGGLTPSAFELEHLAAVYGIDAEQLLEPIELERGDGIPLLAELSEFSEVGDGVRLAVMRVAAAAKDLIKLRGASTLRATRNELPKLKLDPALEPHQQGAKLAVQLRRAWRISPSKEIESVRDLVTGHVPSLNVLYSHLFASGPAGLAFADEMRGATLVLNLDGRNENPLVRRFSLLHELCHFLIDWSGHRQLMELSGYLNEAHRAREQRANAFAVRFLCPEKVLEAAASSPESADVVRAIEPYGLHYGAMRLYLRNRANTHLPPQPPPSMESRSKSWEERESPLGIEPFPLPEVPPERRSMVAELAARRFVGGTISRSSFARLLGTKPTSPVERVLDVMGLTRPESTT